MKLLPFHGQLVNEPLMKEPQMLELRSIVKEMALKFKKRYLQALLRSSQELAKFGVPIVFTKRQQK